MGVETPFVRLSAESFAKNIIRHSDIPLDVYCALPELISGKDLPCYKEANANKIICFANKNKYYKAVIKATKKELFLISLVECPFNQIQNNCLKNGIKIIDKQLKYELEK